jgi:hypothetical protein
MTPAEAIKILDLLPYATREQIEERFVEQRALLEDKAARALTPKLQAQYREALVRVTEAYETLVLAEESATLPSLQSAVAAPAAPANPPPPADRAAARADAVAASAAVDSFGPWIGRQFVGACKALLAAAAGGVCTGAVIVAVETHHLVLPAGVEKTALGLGVSMILVVMPALGWWVHSVRSARRDALAKLLAGAAPYRAPKRPLAWSLALLTLVAALLARYYVELDSQESAAADAHAEHARNMERRQNWAQAVMAFAEARARRPYHEGYQRWHDQAQQSWIDALTGQLKAMPPEQAYAQLTQPAVRPTLWLTSPTRERYQQLFGQTVTRLRESLEKELAEVGGLVAQGKLPEARALVEKLRPVARWSPEFPAAADQVEIAEFELRLAPVQEAQGKQAYAEAYALLEKVEPKTALTRRHKNKIIVWVHLGQFMEGFEQVAALIQKGEFIEAQDRIVDLDVIVERMAGLADYAEAMKDRGLEGGNSPAALVGLVREGWRGAVGRQTAAELVEALATRDAVRAQDILSGHAELNGHEPSVPGEALVKEKSLAQFLRYLDILNLRKAGPDEPDAFSCLALVEAALPQLADAEAGRKFLAEGYHAWAQLGLKNGRPGLALYLQRESVRVGGAPDEALETAACKLFAENNPVRIAFPWFAKEGEQPTSLADSLYEAVKTAVETASQGLFMLELGLDEDNPRQFVLKGELSDVDRAQSSKNERKTVRYVTGEKQAENPAYVAERKELESVNRLYLFAYSRNSEAKSKLETALKSGDSKTITERKTDLANWERLLVNRRNQIADLQAKLQAIPPTVSEAVFAEQPYQQLTNHLNHTAALQLKLAHGNLPEGGQPVAAWQAALRYSAVQITGDIQRGVPAQPAVFLDDATVKRRLTEDFQAKIAAQTPAVLWQLAQAVYAAKEKQMALDSNGTRQLSGDFQWGWAAFWQKRGVPVPILAAEAAARQDAGLPPRVATTEVPFVPPTGWMAENSLGMRFAAVPGTKALVSVWETRVQDFASFVNESGYVANGDVSVLTAKGWEGQAGSWRSPGFKQEPTHPVCGVSWPDARAFCAWLTKKERAAGNLEPDREYRLPTIAEWKLAAGSSLGGIWPRPGAGNLAGIEVRDGNAPADLKFIAGYADGFARTAPVGWFSSNEFGLYDLEGNVHEWCQPDDGPSAGVPVPTLGSSYATAESETGGIEPRQARAMPEMRNSSQGFRIVLAPVVAVK